MMSGVPGFPGLPGPTNSVVDVAGLRVGHATVDRPGWLTGVTAVVAQGPGAVCGVDVRGGGPGTRETDLLDPRNLVDRVNAVVLSGGSALGLAAADGVAQALLDDGIGWPMGAPGQVVPIVPAAILFDLGRGGGWGRAPSADDGASAYAAASQDAVPQGNVGAGTGAKAGFVRGGLGSASAVLPDGSTVAALVACNAVGSPVDLRTGRLYAECCALPGEFDELPTPSETGLNRLRELQAAQMAQAMAGQATTLAVVATDVSLSKAQCHKLAGVAHDGFARALQPVHSLFDGDTVFALSTTTRPTPDPAGLVVLMETAAHCVTRAIGHAVSQAVSVDRTSEGGVGLTAWREVVTA